MPRLPVCPCCGAPMSKPELICNLLMLLGLPGIKVEEEERGEEGYKWKAWIVKHDAAEEPFHPEQFWNSKWAIHQIYLRVQKILKAK